MDRNYKAFRIYHFCFGFSNLFPVKVSPPLLGQADKCSKISEGSICFTCLEPATVSMRAVLSSPDCRLDSLAVSSFLLPCRSLDKLFTNPLMGAGFIFSCVLPLAWCIALGKLLNLAKTLLFPLQSGVNSGHPSPLALRSWDEKCCRDSRY